jgi:hypothetical protein
MPLPPKRLVALDFAVVEEELEAIVILTTTSAPSSKPLFISVLVSSDKPVST